MLTQHSLHANADQDLLAAAGTNDLVAARKLIPLAANLVNPPGVLQETPLIVAAAHGYLEMVRLLLPISQWDDTASGDVAEMSQALIRRRLIDTELAPGARAHVRDPDALAWALFQGFPDIAHAIAEAVPPGFFSDPGRASHAAHLLWTAVAGRNSDLDCLRIAIDLLGDAPDGCGSLALRIAAHMQKIDFLRLLLPISDPLEGGQYGFTALISSCTRPIAMGRRPINGQCAQALLGVSDTGARTRLGLTAWDMAISHEVWPCVDILATERLAREPDNARLRDFLRERKAQLPQSNARLDAEELLDAIGAEEQSLSPSEAPLARAAARSEAHSGESNDAAPAAPPARRL